MTLPNQDDFRLLLTHRATPCVSIYVPARVDGPDDRDGGRIRLKNALSTARDALAAHMAPRAVAEMLDSAENWLATNTPWLTQADGIAVFIAPDTTRIFQVPLTLPTRVVLGRRFHVRPLLPLIDADDHAFVLALSAARARLLRVTATAVTDITPSAMPDGIDDALFADQPEAQLQLHTGRTGATGRHEAIFHGQGVPEGDARERRYAQIVADVVDNALAGERAPLLLAAVASWFHPYAQAGRYPHRLDDGLAGNPDNLSDDQLGRAAWERLASHFDQPRRDALAAYRALATTDQTAATLEEIVPAATYGRIDTLFVPTGEPVWGRFQPQTNTLSRCDGPPRSLDDDDLIDLAAVQTLINGGTVYTLNEDAPDAANAADAPDAAGDADAPALALLRY